MRAPRPLILASASPQRRTLLKTLQVPFRIVPSGVSERSPEKRPRRLVELLALRKARDVAGRRTKGLVLGADTIVVCRGAILGKPRSAADARRMVSLLSGSWHRVYTGVALVDAGSGRAWRATSVSRVKARRITDREAAALAGKHRDKAGGYALQDREDPFVEKVVGPVDNVIGLPLSVVRKLLRRAARDAGKSPHGH